MSETDQQSASDPVAAEPRKAANWRVLLAGRNPRVTLARACVLATICFVLFKFILLPARITGESMEPTYRNGGVNLINRLGYIGSKPQRGDVIGVTLTGRNIQYFKRIIAMPGEAFRIREGVVYIDGQALAETYTTPNVNWTTKEETSLGPTSYVVIGDNRSMDMALHEWGIIKRDRIVGKAVF